MVFSIGGGDGSRTRVRKSSAFGSTCLAGSINLIACYPNGRKDRQRFRKVLTNPPRTCFIASLCESTPGSARISTQRSDGTLLGIKQRVRSCLRSQLYRLQLDLRGCCASACPSGFATHVEANTPPIQLKVQSIKLKELGEDQTNYNLI